MIDIRQAFGIVSVVVSHGSMDRLTWDMRTRQKASRFFLSNSTAYNGVARDFQPWWGDAIYAGSLCPTPRPAEPASAIVPESAGYPGVMFILEMTGLFQHAK